MSGTKTAVRFTWSDLEQWVEKGLITQDQERGIRRYVEAAGPVAEQARAGPEQREGFNLVTIAYYFGGVLILLAYAVLLGLQWESLSYAGQTAIVLVTISTLLVFGYVSRGSGFPLAGNLLAFAGVGIVPLLVYSALQMVGAWPVESAYSYSGYHYRSAIADMFVCAVGILAAAVALWRVRFPLLVLLIALWSWVLCVDLAGWLNYALDRTGTSYLNVASSAAGAAMLALGILIERWTQRDYSLWLYISGHVLMIATLPFLLVGRGVLPGLLFLVVYLGFVVASAWLQRRIFLLFGAIGCYGYLAFLAVDVFEGSLGFVFALAGIGLLIILSAVGYQRYGRPWLEHRLRPYRRMTHSTAADLRQRQVHGEG